MQHVQGSRVDLLLLDIVDHETDGVIQKSLREMKGVTQLIIAHRLRSVMDADRIVRTCSYLRMQCDADE